MSNFESPIPMAEIESVLEWVDTFKLSRPTKKINRDFSDAVLLAEMLSVHYPKLVEMHNYPPRNSHGLKLNNWMTLNRKVLKKLKLNLCCNTMEQLAKCTPGIIERVLLMVHDKIRRDEELNKSTKDAEQNVSSGGSYYEACGDDEHILMVPVKTRVNGVLETVQQKVVSYDSYLKTKEEMKDLNDANEVLKQKVEHLDNLLKLKEERIEELQKQLERKQTRRKEVEAYQNSLAVPFDTSVPPSPKVSDTVIHPAVKTPLLKSIDTVSNTKIKEETNTKVKEESKIPVPKVDSMKIIHSKPSITEVAASDITEANTKLKEESKVPIPKVDSIKNIHSKPSITEVAASDITDDINGDVNRIRSDVFKEIEIIEEKSEGYQDMEEFKDSEQGVITIEDTIHKEITDIVKPIYEQNHNISYIN